MQKIIDFLRIKEWFTSKCSLMIGIFIYCYLKTGYAITYEFWLLLVSFIIFISFFLAFGYVINDFCDREIDKMAGKKKIIASLPYQVCILILVAMIVAAVCPILIVGRGKIQLIVAVAATIFWGMSYSAPPFRFKEKGIWGLIVSSIAQRCMPLWVLYELIPLSLKEFVLWETLSFFIGLRYILVHQRIDAQNDLKTGTVTFATRQINFVKKGIYLSFTVEILCLFLLFAPWEESSFLIVAGITCLYVIWQGLIVRKKLHENMFMTFSCVPLEDFYNFFIPAVYLGKLINYTWISIIFLFGFIVVMWKSQWEKWKFLFFNIV